MADVILNLKIKEAWIPRMVAGLEREHYKENGVTSKSHAETLALKYLTREAREGEKKLAQDAATSIPNEAIESGE